MSTTNTYRPTVRMDERFRDYLDQLHEATTLDRNQLIRLAIYVLMFTVEGITIVESFSKPDVKAENPLDIPIPLPDWDLFDDWHLWLVNHENLGDQELKEDVMAKVKKRVGEETRKKKRRDGEPTTKKKRRSDDDDGKRTISFTEKGGISYHMA